MDSQFPWTLKQHDLDAIDALVRSLKIPSGRIQRPFRHNSFVKSHDWILLGKGIGKFLIATKLPPPYSHWIVRFFDWITVATSATISPQMIDTLKVEIYHILAQMEVIFPMFMCTINFHLLVHLPETLRKFGPVQCHQMYAIERFNRTVKNMVQVRHPLPPHSVSIYYLSSHSHRHIYTSYNELKN